MTTLLSARFVVGFDGESHVVYENGEVAFERDRIVFVGHGFQGPVARRIECGDAIAAPGFIDLDALADLDTTILSFDNHPAWAKGRVWPQSYMDAGPFEMYTPAELALQARYALVQLIRNGITTVLPIASLFYRAWGETYDQFAAIADIAAELGVRVYLGPAYRAGNSVIYDDGRLDLYFDEARGLAGLDEALRFARAFEGRHDGLIRAMLAPDRIETCTPELLRRTAAASRDLGLPVRQHCAQSQWEYDSVRRLRGMSPIEWLASLDFLSPRALLPHGVFVNDNSRVARAGDDLGLIARSGATIVSCPLVMARGGQAIESHRRLRERGINIGMGTDTWPPDMIENLRQGLLACRLVERDPAACRAEDMFDAATLGGARALGRADLGRLAPGAKADIAVIDLRHSRTGQVIDPIQTLLISGAGRDVKTVFIDGRTVMEDGVIPGVDLDGLAAEAQAQFDRLVRLYPRRTFRHPPVEEIFSSAYRRRPPTAS